MNFTKFDDKAMPLLKRYLSQTDYTGSDYSYYAFLIWFDEIEYAEKDGAFFIRAFFNGKLRYWAPLVLDESSLTVKDAVKMLEPNSSFAFVTSGFASQMLDEYVECTNRDWSEYIYRASDFIGLSGKRYAAKRNHISRFLKNYVPQMSPYTANDRAEVESFEKEWMDAKDFASEAERESAVKESEILFTALDASLKGDTVCDILRINGSLAGFSAAEIMPSGNAVVMIEKADVKYDGIYSYLAHEFAARNLKACEFINRQEDMGVEGLRKSKLSYYPEFLLDKYVLTPIEECVVDDDGSFVRPCDGDSSLSAEKSVSDHHNVPSTAGLHSEETIAAAQNLQLDGYEYRKLGADDFNAVMGFFKCGISQLDDKLFFMNYTDEELKDVLENGYMLAAAFDGHIVATCALDFDKAFGDKLAKICGETGGRQFYEFSGIMVCPHHRGKGLARTVCQKTIEYAKQNLKNATLCATVQFNNQKSLNNLHKLGFCDRAEAAYKAYNFKYLTLEIN